MDRKIASALTVLLFTGIILLPIGLSVDNVVAAQNGTLVGGILWDNTTWTTQGSPYTFVGNITVASNATLTIMPGAVIHLGLQHLGVDGTLRARGDAANRIIIDGQKQLSYSWPPRIYFNTTSTPWNERDGTGSIIEYAEINVPNWQYETIIGDLVYPRISNNIMYNYGNDAAAVRVNGLVVNNTIFGGARGILGESSTVIVSNTVKDAEVGIACGYMSFDPIYHPIIIGNLLTNNIVGIDDYSSAPFIVNNTITGNKNGFHFTSYTFDRGAEPVAIAGNNIYNNTINVQVDFVDNQKTVNMINNWWGTTDASMIAKSICDKNSLPVSGKIDFNPFLSEPNAQATPDVNQVVPSPSMPPATPTPIPTIEPTATPTPTPEPNAFHIESNSTVSALSFNGTSGEITFTVNGTSGTTGYVKATISKNFMPNGSNINVYLDEKLIDSLVTSNGDYWIITFTYHHSTHQVKISQTLVTNPASEPPDYLPYIAGGVVAALLGFLAIIVWLVRTKK